MFVFICDSFFLLDFSFASEKNTTKILRKELVKIDTLCRVTIIQLPLFSPLTFPAHKWHS